MPDSVAAVRVVIAGQRLNYALSQAWVPLPPGITALPAAPAPVSDITYGEVLTPTALLRPYQESIRVDCVVKVQMTQRRLEYPLELPTREDTMTVRAIGAPTLHLGDFDSALAPKVTATLASREVFQTTSLAPRVQFQRITEWTPLDLSPAAWLDASDAATITIDTGAVYQWGDKSGNNNHCVYRPASGVYDPARSPTVAAAAQNGLDVLRFDGSNDRLEMSVNTKTLFGFSGGDGGEGVIFDFTIMVAAKITSVTTNVSTTWQNNDTVWTMQNSIYTALVARTVGSNTVYFRNTISSAWPSGEIRVATVTGTTPTNLYMNNTDIGTGSFAYASGYDGTFLAPILIGQGFDLFNYMGMDLCEVIMLPRKISPSELTSAVTYLAAKWGITV
jgi:hypothetical protein